MASSPITSWQIKGEKVETMTDFVFLGSKITVDGDCSQEIKRRLLLGREAMTNLDGIWKSRDITLPTKVCIVKAMVVVMHGSHVQMWELDHKEGWARRIDAFKLWCWRRLETKPINPKRNQPWIVIERTDNEAEIPILWPQDAKSQLWKRPWLWERLKAGGEEDNRGWDC